MKTYRCKHAVEAARWVDTDENRAAFSLWLEEHGATFETRGPEIVLPEGDFVTEGEWVLFMDSEFIVMDDGTFTETYEAEPSLKALHDLQRAVAAWQLAECETQSPDTDDYVIASMQGECAGDTHAETCMVTIAQENVFAALAVAETAGNAKPGGASQLSQGLSICDTRKRAETSIDAARLSDRALRAEEVSQVIGEE